MRNDMKYRKKPVVIEAFKFYVDNIPDWFMDRVSSNDIVLRNCDYHKYPIEEAYCEINTLEGVMIGKGGDYIIKGVNGEIYPCKPDIFEKTYEKEMKMSKDLEALNRLISFDKECNCISQAAKDDFALIKQALDELECAKHNYGALEEFYNNSVAYGTRIQKELNELKKLNEPMKPTLDENNNHRCARCHHIVDNHYCSDCGGAVDWGKENESV